MVFDCNSTRILLGSCLCIYRAFVDGYADGEMYEILSTDKKNYTGEKIVIG